MENFLNPRRAYSEILYLEGIRSIALGAPGNEFCAPVPNLCRLRTRDLVLVLIGHDTKWLP